MTLNQIKIIAAMIVLLAIGFVVEWAMLRKESPTPSPQQINFDTSGHIVRNSPGLKADTWYLLYEQPGAAALSVELIFNDKSSCFEDEIKSCSDIDFYNGQPVHVGGFRQDGIVIVSNLIVISDVEPPKMQTIKLYYYNPDKDKDTSGSILCSRKGLEAIERQIPLTMTPIQDTIKLLLQGNLTAAEKAREISTEYPLPGVELKGANLTNGILTLEFVDPQNKTGGGSCRVGILWFQIEATAKQFPEVKEVKFKPEELFQP